MVPNYYQVTGNTRLAATESYREREEGMWGQPSSRSLKQRMERQCIRGIHRWLPERQTCPSQTPLQDQQRQAQATRPWASWQLSWHIQLLY